MYPQSIGNVKQQTVEKPLVQHPVPSFQISQDFPVIAA
jgi:hypothetical protein